MVKHRGDNICGVILLDKPSGRSSNFYLQRVKYLLNARKAGHTGSLDPLATGLLPLCFGKATCLSDYFLHSDKAYEAIIQLGVTTNSHDCDGEVLEEREVNITEQSFHDILKRFEGEVEQIPPMVSALKHKGQPLYKLALQGKVIERKPRKMTVYSLQGELMEHNQAKLTVHCSSGFYVRQLAADIGEKLGCGAHITALRRTQSKKITLKKAISFEQIADELENADQQTRDKFLKQYLLGADEVLYFLPQILVDEQQAEYLSNGRKVSWADSMTDYDDNMHIRVYQRLPNGGQHFLGIGEKVADQQLKVRRLFNTYIKH